MSKKIRLVIAALVIGFATLLASAPATAHSQGEVPELKEPAGNNLGIMASMCTTLTTAGGAKADVCRASYSESDGAGYHGWYAGTVFGISFVQVYIDGMVEHLARPDGCGTFRYASNVRLRVCNSAGCGGWW